MPAFFQPLSRRAFIHQGSLLLLSAGVATKAAAADEQPPRIRVGLVTDMHYADKPAGGTRHYRDTLTKLAEAAKQFTADKTDFVVELGDFIDAADSVEAELGYLQQVNKVFSGIAGPRHYVLGNHCVDTLTKKEFLDGVGKKESFYAFDADGFHFVVLDACFNPDGSPYGRRNSDWLDANIPAAELDWLRADLKKTDHHTIVFIHQRLDEGGAYTVRNAADVRKILETSGKVHAVFQGHSHRNDHQEIAGIHYATLVAMVEGAGPENSGFSTLELFASGAIKLNGFRKQSNYRWA